MNIYEENENLVTEEVVETTEQVAEKVEQTTEQTPKTYTEEEFNAKVNEIAGKRVARKEAKIRKEVDREYGELIEVLRAGTGKETVAELKDTFKQFYEKKGVQMPQKPSYSDSDIAMLARAEADDIISSGYEEVVEEVDRLTEIGIANMTAREKALFKTLAEHRQDAERSKALAEIGVSDAEYNSPEFKKFAAQFNATTPITDVYKLFAKTSKTSSVEPIGSMKNGSHDGEKTYYSPEDFDKLTPKDLDNPVIFQRVRESMKSW